MIFQFIYSFILLTYLRTWLANIRHVRIRIFTYVPSLTYGMYVCTLLSNCNKAHFILQHWNKAQFISMALELGTIQLWDIGIRHNSFEGCGIRHNVKSRLCAKFHHPQMNCALFQCSQFKLCLIPVYRI